MLQMYEHQRDDMLTTTCWRKQNDFFAPHFHSSIELVYTPVSYTHLFTRDHIVIFM